MRLRGMRDTRDETLQRGTRLAVVVVVLVLVLPVRLFQWQRTRRQAQSCRGGAAVLMPTRLAQGRPWKRFGKLERCSNYSKIVDGFYCFKKGKKRGLIQTAFVCPSR